MFRDAMGGAVRSARTASRRMAFQSVMTFASAPEGTSTASAHASRHGRLPAAAPPQG